MGQKVLAGIAIAAGLLADVFLAVSLDAIAIQDGLTAAKAQFLASAAYQPKPIPSNNGIICPQLLPENKQGIILAANCKGRWTDCLVYTLSDLPATDASGISGREISTHGWVLAQWVWTWFFHSGDIGRYEPGKACTLDGHDPDTNDYYWTRDKQLCDGTPIKY